MEKNYLNKPFETTSLSPKENQHFWDKIIASQKDESNARHLIMQSRGNQYINQQQLPKGEHFVRFIVDPEQKLFHEWKTVYLPGHFRQANVCDFIDCSTDICQRIENARKKPNFPFRNNFWEQHYAYMYVENTSVDNKYFSDGKMYVVSMKTNIKNSLLRHFSKMCEQDFDAASRSFTLSEDAPGIRLTVGESVHADLDTDSIVKSPEFGIRMQDFVPLSQLWQYDSNIAHAMANHFEKVASEL